MRNAVFTIVLLPLLATLPAAGQATPVADVQTLAADVTGTWKTEFDSQVGRQKCTFTFKQEGAKLTGKANAEIEGRKGQVRRVLPRLYRDGSRRGYRREG